MTVVTRFAPSPTGDLHIGGVRTAIFNWLYARRHNGQFKLRIEDTDAQRSSQDSIDHIIDSLNWIGLDSVNDTVFQSARANRHLQVAHQLVHMGHAYRDYTSEEEIGQLKAAHVATGSKAPFRYLDNPWRDFDGIYPPGLGGFTIRIKAPRIDQTVINDLVQGTVTVDNSTLDDMILVRSDETPTYMLAVVVDDYDMGVTHVIRGDDHLNNAFRQLTIINAMGWPVPTYAHIPLIHGEDGKKLSKRHGAAGLDHYRDLGITPEGMFSYLTRLGWGQGDDEIISRDDAVKIFDVKDVIKSPARIDMKKLNNVNFQVMMHMDPAKLFNLILKPVEAKLGRQLSYEEGNKLAELIPELQPRAKTLNEMVDGSIFLFKDDIEWNDKAKNKFNSGMIIDVLTNIDHAEWSVDGLHGMLLNISVANEDKFANVVQPVRIALTGSTISPGIGEIMIILGKDEVVKRLQASIKY